MPEQMTDEQVAEGLELAEFARPWMKSVGIWSERSEPLRIAITLLTLQAKLEQAEADRAKLRALGLWPEAMEDLQGKLVVAETEKKAVWCDLAEEESRHIETQQKLLAAEEEADRYRMAPTAPMTPHKIGDRTREEWITAPTPGYSALLEHFFALLDAAFSADDPQWDCTDAAHPAWWRGQDYGANAIVREVGKILDGTHDAEGTSSGPWESIRRKLIALVSAEERVQQLEADIKWEQTIRADVEQALLREQEVTHYRAWKAAEARVQQLEARIARLLSAATAQAALDAEAHGPSRVQRLEEALDRARKFLERSVNHGFNTSCAIDEATYLGAALTTPGEEEWRPDRHPFTPPPEKPEPTTP